MQLNEFENIVLPILQKVLLLEDASFFSPETKRNLWLASAARCDDQDWKSRYAAIDAKDALLRFHPSILKVCRVVRRNYEELCRMKSEGCTEARMVVSEKCMCLAALDGKRISIDNALTSFDVYDETVETLLRLTEPCSRREDPQICDVWVVPILTLDKNTDADFAAEITRILASPSA